MRWYSLLVSLDGDAAGADTGADTRSPRYEIDGAERGHRPRVHVTSGEWIVLAACVASGVALGAPPANRLAPVLVAGVGAATVSLILGRRRLLAVGALVLLVVGGARGAQGWEALESRQPGPFEGWVRVVDDPQPYGGGTRVVIEVEGERFESWTRGRAARERVATWRAGDLVEVAGERSALDPVRARRVAWEHVVGRFEVEWRGDVRAGGPAWVASNRVRAAIERASTHLPAADGALFRGLVVGDDRDQPREMIERFRRTGLSHLTAVSGQNVSFLLAASGPLLTRLRPVPRWVCSLGLIAWFVLLTRFEPSIVRAGVMAGLSTTAFLLGRDRSPVRILAVAVVALVLVDPLLVWSIGFWLSVGATLGVSGAGPWIARRLRRFDPSGLFCLPIGVTLGAQLGVLVPSVLVFGRLPLVSLPANLLAVPVAGAVMLYGLPAGLVAGWCPPVAPLLMFPARLGTRWVDTVARLGDLVEPGPRGQLIGWVVVTLVVVALVALGARRIPAADS